MMVMLKDATTTAIAMRKIMRPAIRNFGWVKIPEASLVDRFIGDT